MKKQIKAIDKMIVEAAKARGIEISSEEDIGFHGARILITMRHNGVKMDRYGQNFWDAAKEYFGN